MMPFGESVRAIMGNAAAAPPSADPRGPARPRPLHRFFAAVHRRYDLINRLITLGLDERWRRLAARECLRAAPARVLDLCCGTGDLALRLARMAPRGVEVVAADYSAPMLRLARRKAAEAKLGGRVSFVVADAASLPFAEGHFDAVGIAFAFRNLCYRNPLRDRHLAEMRRVLAPGGVCVIVESSQPARFLVRAAYHCYLRSVVGPLGGLISGHGGAYRYLAESAANFDGPGDVSRLLMESGFREVRYRSLALGVAALHAATK
jgi:demethylmenaquinone methyltransferase/2-methoxy-6-polyprenyl-1,4-benzoquinol methylase